MASHDKSPSDPVPSGQEPSTDPYAATRKSGPSPTPAPSPSATPPEIASAPPSAKFGKFVRVAKLGAGGMGEVWKAWDAELSRWVALKFMKIPDPEELARFKREAQVAGRLSHPNIAAVYEFGESAGTPWIAMEYIPGQTLKSFPRNDRRILVGLIRDAARALQYANEEGIVHRDLKPENLMVVERKKPGTGRFKNGEHRVYVMDFGLARPAEGAGDLSASGLIVGTPQYMSPEQARGEKVDARADVWSLGATLYELLTDRKPFTGANLMEVLKAVQEAEPKAPRKIDLKIDPDLETVLLKCLEKDKERRYASAGELAEDLTRWLDGEPVTARPISGFERFGRKVRRHKALSATAAALLVVAIGGGVALGIQRQRTTTALATKDAERSASEARLKESSQKREEALRELATLWSAIVEKKRDLRQLKVPAERAVEELKKAIAAVEEHIQRWPEEPQGYYLAARGWMYLGDLDRAEKAIRIAVAKEPEFRPGWSLLGMVKLEQHDVVVVGIPETLSERIKEARLLLDEGQKAFERGWEEGREREEAQKWGLAWTAEDAVMRRLSRAEQLVHEERTKDARRLLEEGLAEYRAEEYFVALAHLSHATDAEMRLFADAIGAAPGYQDAYVRRGRAKVDRGDLAGAIADFDRAIELRKDDPRAYDNRGTAKSVQRDYAGAIADFDRAIELRKDEPVAYNNRGIAKLYGGDPAGAIADFDRTLELKKDDPDAYYNRGNAKKERGDLAGAMADFDRAIELKEDYPQVYVNRGNTKGKRGDPAGAMADYDRAIELKKDLWEAYVNRGEAKLDRGDFAGAIADYDRSLELKKDYVPAYYNRGLAKQKQGDLEGAIEDYDQTLELRKDDAEAYRNRGLSKRALKDARGAAADFEAALRVAPAGWRYRAQAEADLNEARREAEKIAKKAQGDLADYDRAVELEKDNPRAYYNRGDAKEAQGDLAGAIADYSRAIELKKDYALPYISRGIAKGKRGDLAGALADFDRAIELKKDYPDAYYNRGIAKEMRGDLAGAMADYDQAIKLRDYAQAYVNRGAIKQKQGDLAGAIEDFDRAIALEKDLPEAYANRGNVKWDRGDLAGAIEDFDRAIELKKDFAGPYFIRGRVKQKQGDLAGAIADYSRAIKLKKDDAEVYYNRGKAKEEQGDPAGAIADYSRAIELKKDYPEAYNKRGIAKGEQDNPAGAIEDFDRAIELNKDYLEAHLNRGIAKEMRGDLAGARADYDRAIELKKDFPEAYYNRGIVKQEQGDLAGAITDFDRAIELKLNRKDLPGAYRNRGNGKRAQGDLVGAIADYEAALRVAPAGWPYRARLERDLSAARSKVDK